MANAAFAYENYADAVNATIIASSFAILTPPSVLKNPHIARKWRGQDGDTEYIVVDLGGPKSIDTVALIGCNGLFDDAERNLSAAAVTRVRVSAGDSSGAAGELYDSGDVSGRIDQKYGSLIELLPAPVTGRFVRIDVSEAGAEYLQAGRLVVSLRHEMRINFSFGWSRAWVDRSRRVESRGGQIYVDHDTTYRTADLEFQWVTQDERWGAIEEMDRVNGQNTDVLFIADPDSDNLGRDSIWGLIDDQRAVTQPAVWIDGAPAYSKSYRIRERQ